MMPKVIKVVMFAALTALSVVNIFLIEQNSQLKNNLQLTIDKEIKRGEQIRNFDGIDMGGHLATVDMQATNKNTALIAFSYLCPECKSNFVALKNFAGNLNPDQWQVVWLSVDKYDLTRKVFTSEDVPGRVISGFSCRDLNRLGLRKVPRLILVRPGGTVEAAWAGGFNKATWAEIDRYLAYNDKIRSWRKERDSDVVPKRGNSSRSSRG